jgi:hypothetical protein
MNLAKTPPQKGRAYSTARRLFIRARRSRLLVDVGREVAIARAERSQPASAVSNDIVVVSIYREKNIRVLQAFLRQCPSNADIRLWALDCHDYFPGITVGSGPGGKFELVNRLIGCKPIGEQAWIVVADDDVLFVNSSLAAFITLCARARLDLAQPSHSIASHFNHTVTVARPWSRLALTGFVEIGPLLALGPRGRDDFIPFEEGGMGWGLEFSWNNTIKKGRRLGIVDACKMVHLVPAGGDYSPREEFERGPGLDPDELRKLKVRYRTWYVWESSARF